MQRGVNHAGAVAGDGAGAKKRHVPAEGARHGSDLGRVRADDDSVKAGGFLGGLDRVSDQRQAAQGANVLARQAFGAAPRGDHSENLQGSSTSSRVHLLNIILKWAE